MCLNSKKTSSKLFKAFLGNKYKINKKRFLREATGHNDHYMINMGSQRMMIGGNWLLTNHYFFNPTVTCWYPQIYWKSPLTKIHFCSYCDRCFGKKCCDCCIFQTIVVIAVIKILQKYQWRSSVLEGNL